MVLFVGRPTKCSHVLQVIDTKYVRSQQKINWPLKARSQGHATHFLKFTPAPPSYFSSACACVFVNANAIMVEETFPVWYVSEHVEQNNEQS